MPQSLGSFTVAIYTHTPHLIHTLTWPPDIHTVFPSNISLTYLFILLEFVYKNSNDVKRKTTIKEESGIIRCKICRHKNLCHNQKARLESVYENRASPFKMPLSFWSCCEKPVMKLQSDWLVGFIGLCFEVLYKEWDLLNAVWRECEKGKKEWLSAENNNLVSLTSPFLSLSLPLSFPISISISNRLSGKHWPIKQRKRCTLAGSSNKKQALKNNKRATTKKPKQCKAANILHIQLSVFSFLSSRTTSSPISCFLSHVSLRFCTAFGVTCFSPAANQITWIITSQRTEWKCVCDLLLVFIWCDGY